MFFANIRWVSLASVAAVLLSMTACSGSNQSTTSPSPQAEGGSPDASQTTAAAPGASPASNLSGEIKVDGSSTVFLISEAMAEEFQKTNTGVRANVGESGTGGGFKKFCGGEIDITGASRPIKDEEAEACQKANIDYIELPVAYDALTVVAHPENTAAKCMKVEDLKKAWEPAAQGKITNWNQIRSDLPDQKLGLYGPGTDSGTFEYFTKAVVGKEKESRGDYTASEDDNTLVQGVSGDKGGLGYFGYGYYEQNKDKLQAVSIDAGKGCVAPSPETVLDGTYQPLARPIFIYVKKASAERPEVKAFVDFYLANQNKQLVSEVGYIPLPDDLATTVQNRFKEAKVGTVFEDGSATNVSLKDLLGKEK